MQCYLGLTVLILVDRVLKVLLKPIHFPSPLIGMACIVTSLVIARQWGIHHKPQRFFAPAVEWVAHKWLPCFYCPALVTLPLALAPLPPQAMASAVVIIFIGVVLTCGFTSRVAMAIRTATGSDYVPVVDQDCDHPIIFSNINYYLWSGAALISCLVLLLGPSATNPHATFILLLASTILGYMAGMALPEPIKKVLHPMVVTAAVPNVVAVVLGLLNRRGYHALLQGYVTKGAGGWYGPGDLLFSFLGVIILCFGFKIFEQWTLLCRHAWEVLGATSASAAFSMISTAALGRLAGLPPDLARGLVPRAATLALALPIADRLGASPQLTAAAVGLTGIIGCNFVQSLMTAFGAKDPISRGLAAAAAAHGLGTAAMAANEPGALPFAALSYALCGVSASLLVCIPLFRDILLAITG